MKLEGLSICFHTTKVEECKEFYVKYFSGEIIFDCGWYVSIVFNKERCLTLQFMIPQDDTPVYGEKGVTLNLGVKDVDAEYQRLIVENKLPVQRDLQDQPWGDRSFTIFDPLGNTLYIYSDREMSDEYKEAVKQ
ncbi:MULTISPECIES: VOC family protein [unclassified Dysgonomonas]|uniref:VOC family protein n=1 Tax=unclassified Dysgonomonas TaxID=2630389 RepID=UPI0013EB13D3|nr:MULTISPECIES: VOC family protein [unclassified Dysgonomonas]